MERKLYITLFRELWENYRSEVFFFVILSACVTLGHWLSRFIPEDLINSTILPIQHGGIVATCLIGALLMFHRSDGLRIRRACGYALIIWGLADSWLLFQDYIFQYQILRIGANAFNAYDLFFCNFLGWILLIYPTETLRPGWLNMKRALYQILPMGVLVALDYVIPWDLRWIISLYPAALFIMVITHIRAYRKWCEENYSSMEHIDAPWIVRYLIMVLVIGLSYLYIALSQHPTRVVTQNILLGFLFFYSIDEILFRKDPWTGMVANEANGDSAGIEGQSDSARLLEQWMESEKPYLNPDFQLMDLRAVLPMNRTYLSQFINTTYGCSFYLFANRYRIEEAKRLMRENPDMKLADVAERTGFSSQTVFSQVFTKQTGMSPRRWSKS